MRSYQQKEIRAALFTWRFLTLFGFFRPWLILIPFAIIGCIHDVPYTSASFKYKEVYVFGVRIVRVQVG